MATSVTGSRFVRTCTECKQAKLRCDARERFPNPCSRCQTRQLFCTVDASFQRKPARKRMEALRQEIQELRNQRSGGHSTSQSDLTFDSGVSPDSALVENVEDNFELDNGIISLNDTLVESHLAVQAFKEFAGLFRPQLPLIGSISMRRIYDSQPFLFWTIVIVVASHFPGSPNHELYGLIQEPYRELLKEEILNAPLPLHKIQALLILCIWPLPVGHQPNDPSWLYCGIAIQAARYMSLDREQSVPSLRSLGVASDSAQSRVNTWLACFYIATSLSMHLGLPPPIEGDLDFTTTTAFLGRNTLPSDFAVQVRVQLVVAKFTNVLMHNTSEATSSSLIRLLNNELDVLKSDLFNEDEQATMVEFNILVAQLHFYALLITRIEPRTSFYQITLKTAFAAALRTIHISNSRICSGSVSNSDTFLIKKQRSLPKNYYRGLAFATIFLLRFFHQNGEAPLDEWQSAANHIAMAQNVFNFCSTEPRDEYGRTAKFFEILARLAPDVSEPLKLRLKHRMGVSILLDAVSTASEVRGKPVAADDHQPHLASHSASEGVSAESQPPEDLLSLAEQDFLREFGADPIWDMLNFEELPLTEIENWRYQ